MWVDSVAAIVVAILVLFVSYRLGRRTIDALMDRVPEGMYEEVLRTVRDVEGVEDVRSIRMRPSGPKVFVDTTVAIRRTTPFQLAHGIMDKVEKAIHDRHTNVDVIVHAEPFESSDETIADKIRMIVVRKGIRPPHNLEVHDRDGRLHVEFDVEYAAGLPFVEAHKMADEVEADIRRELPSVKHVTVHLEEYLPGQNEVVPRAEDDTLHREILNFLGSQEDVRAYSDVQVLCGEDLCTLTLTCVFDRSLTLAEVHRQVSQLEIRLYDRFSDIRKVTVHAEPAPERPE